jgi:hypothetical protein
VCPSGSIGGVEGCSAVVNDWTSGIADTSRNRLLLWGGGHNGYAGNEVYALDLNNLQIELLDQPTIPQQTSVEAYNDGTPSARHTYGGLSYLPATNGRTKDYMYSVCGGNFSPNGGTTYPPLSTATWLLDLHQLEANGPTLTGAGQIPYPSNTTVAPPAWIRMDPLNGTPLPQQYSYQYQCFSDYDPVGDSVWLWDQSNYLWKYAPSTNTMTQMGYTYGINSYTTALVDYVHHLYLLIGGGGAWQADLTQTTPTLTEIDSSMTGCSAMISQGYPGLAYDPVQDAVVSWIAGTNNVIVYNTTTKTCTTQTYATGPSGLTVTNGISGHFRYFPALGVFALLTNYQQNAWVLRMTAAAGTAGSGPVISALSVASITTTSAVVNWSTDVASTTQVEYGTSTAYGNLTTLNTSLVTSHSQALTGLTAGTLYHYRVHSKNSSGVESVSSDSTFTTSTQKTTPPTVSITAPAPNATVSSTVTVSAAASGSAGIASVQFILDGANLGPAVTASPYQTTWNTSTATNGTHLLTAVALDTAGNSATSAPISVNVNNAGATNALADFQDRCAAPGVIVCQGFDDASVFVPMTNQAPGGTGLYPDGTGGYSKSTMDTTITASGAGSLKFEIDPYTGANVAGAFRQMFSPSPSGAVPSNVQCFGPDPGCSPTFYVQYRFRISPEMVNQDWGDPSNNTNWKFSIFHWSSKTCGSVELTSIDYYQTGSPIMYTDCGGRGLFTNPWPNLTWNNSTPPYLTQQGDTSTTGYNCPYGNITNPDCFFFTTNTWMTFYWKITVGAWGTPTSTIQAWVSPGPGQPLNEWVNLSNFTLNYDTLGEDYNSVELLNYMTGKDASLNHPVAYSWYDEVIVSTQAIAAPKY